MVGVQPGKPGNELTRNKVFLNATIQTTDGDGAG